MQGIEPVEEPVSVEAAELLPWAALESVLEATAESRHCWCRWWLTTNAEYSAKTDDARHDDAASAHADGLPRGLLARRGDDAVGWVSVAPRSDYVRLPRTRLVADGTPDPDFSDPTVWAIVCFAVSPAHRRTGIARALLDAAIAHAAAHGAERIEAYPIDTEPIPDLPAVGSAPGTAPLRPPSPGDLNTGTLALFAEFGFVEVARPQPTRPIVQLTLAPLNAT